MLLARSIQSRAAFCARLVCLLLAAAAQAQDVPVPPLKGRVTDLTGTLDARQTDALEDRLRAFEEKEGSQIAVLIIPTTQPEAIEQYSIRVVEQWKLGREDVDDGALLLIAKQDRALRIEVGYGLEGALTDATSKRIIAEIITPYFRNGDFYSGIRAGVQAMMKVIKGEPLPAPAPESQDDDSGNFPSGFLFFAFMIWLMIFIMTQSGGRAYRGRGLGRRGYYIGGIGMPISGGFGSGGGLGGGGGFSGGGGGFGGGGASGNW